MHITGLTHEEKILLLQCMVAFAEATPLDDDEANEFLAVQRKLESDVAAGLREVRKIERERRTRDDRLGA